MNRYAQEQGILNRNIITCGSSKGGFAALYYSFKYNYGHCISGAPSALLGNYLAPSYHEHILRYIAGGTEQSDIQFMNEILFQTMSQSENAESMVPYIHVSKNEPHYEDSVLHLIDLMKKENISYEMDFATYKEHSEVSIYFPGYALKCLHKIVIK